MWRMKSVVVALAVMVFTAAGENPNCEYRRCSECIGAPTCIWCSHPNITLVESDTGVPLPHCISKESSRFEEFTQACKGGITNPVTVEKIIEDEELSETPIVQLRPQRVSLEIRAGESARIGVKYRHLPNYPLDVYCLMDGSKSMSILKTSLSDLTNDLVKGLEKISNNIQLGFGMFVDKPVLPYTDMNVWSGANCKDCVETFSFKHILGLTSQKEIFQKEVKAAKTSTNVDVPEGTLDALMQVAACHKNVGWRHTGLKVVVVFTDAGFHIAGDGRLAGIANPNDRQCHLDNTGQYTLSKLQDYPSIGELGKVLDLYGLYTTFAVKKDVVPLYEKLASKLPRSQCSDMKEDSSNIVGIITNFTGVIVSTVDMKKPTDIMQELHVNVTSRCKGNEETSLSKCTDMDPGDEAEYFINIKLKTCPPEGRSLRTTLNFTLEGYQKSFLLDLELLCQCECDQEGLVVNADQCNNNGTLSCGVCACNEGFLGDECQCKKGESGSQEVDAKNCIQPNTTSGLVCTGLGQCVCGQCKCFERPDSSEVISGQYCQCTNYLNCYGSNGKICSDHGQCTCNRCVCDDGWQGEHCDCETSTSQCQSGDEEICSSHGKCVCNRCQCEDGYLGKHCQDCQNCQEKCDEHRLCVQCLVFNTEATCKADCSIYNHTIVPDMSKQYGQLCSSIDDDGCTFLFQFKHSGNRVQLWAQKEKECPVEVNPWAVVGGILGAVVVVGLLLLIAWKVITYTKDKHEYERFVKNKNMAIWSANVSPLYKPAVTEVQNPLFEATSSHYN